MADIADDIAYLVALLASGQIVVLMAFVVMLSVVLAIRDGLDRVTI